MSEIRDCDKAFEEWVKRLAANGCDAYEAIVQDVWRAAWETACEARNVRVDAAEARVEALRDIYNQQPRKAIGGYGQLLNLPEWDRWVERLGLVLWLAKEAK